MSDKLEMPIEQFAEAVAKENARLNEHNEKLKEQTKLYFHAFNKATARIEKLEAALDDMAQYVSRADWHYLKDETRKALEGTPDMSVYKEGYRAVEEVMGHPSPEFWVERKYE